MKKYLISSLFFNLLTASLLSGSLSSSPRHEFNDVFIKAAGRAKISVVNIIIYNKYVKNGKKYNNRVGYGSGTIISGNGYIVTNYHVVKKGNYYRVYLFDGTECDLRPIKDNTYYAADIKTDIAILRLDENDTQNIRPIDIGDSSELSEGEWVIAIGNPYGLRQSISSGIVSSKGRSDIGFADIEDFIQTDVPINPGNSGGPLVNLSGELVGINTAIRTITGGYQGISFAIPSNIVKQVCSELIRYGRVRRGWVGFIARDKQVSSQGKKIVEVISVIKDSPAEITGIRSGDVIRKINNEDINSLGELVSSVSNKPIGSKIIITLSRNGKLKEFSLILREKRKYRHLQRGIRSLYSKYGIELDENSNSGELIISYLSPMGIAYQNGLKRGDIVYSLNNKKLKSIDDFINVYFRSGSEISIMKIYRGERLYNIQFLNFKQDN